MKLFGLPVFFNDRVPRGRVLIVDRRDWDLSEQRREIERRILAAFAGLPVTGKRP